MLFTSLSAPKVPQVHLSYPYLAMPHFTRELKHFSTLFEVHLSKGMPERMSRDPHFRYPCLALKHIHYLLNTAFPQRLAMTDKQATFARISGPTKFMDVLPK